MTEEHGALYHHITISHCYIVHLTINNCYILR